MNFHLLDQIMQMVTCIQIQRNFTITEWLKKGRTQVVSLLTELMTFDMINQRVAMCILHSSMSQQP
jgi:hypothetical protein